MEPGIGKDMGTITESGSISTWMTIKKGLMIRMCVVYVLMVVMGRVGAVVLGFPKTAGQVIYSTGRYSVKPLRGVDHWNS